MFNKVIKLNPSGQSSLELMLAMGLIIIPTLMAGSSWVKAEWSKSQCSFQSFKAVRLAVIKSQQKATINGITLLPLEDLDQEKGGLELGETLKEVSQLWEQLSSSSHSSLE